MTLTIVATTDALPARDYGTQGPHTRKDCDDGKCPAHQLCVHYEHCTTQWLDYWNCACDSECPTCGADIEADDWHPSATSCATPETPQRITRRGKRA